MPSLKAIQTALAHLAYRNNADKSVAELSKAFTMSQQSPSTSQAAGDLIGALETQARQMTGGQTAAEQDYARQLRQLSSSHGLASPLAEMLFAARPDAATAARYFVTPYEVTGAPIGETEELHLPVYLVRHNGETFYGLRSGTRLPRGMRIMIHAQPGVPAEEIIIASRSYAASSRRENVVTAAAQCEPPKPPAKEPVLFPANSPRAILRRKPKNP